MKVTEKMKIPTVIYQGEECVKVSHFAQIVGRKSSTVRHMIKYGGFARKLRVLTLDTWMFVPLSELQLYPFTSAGNKGGVPMYYHYDEEGRRTKEQPISKYKVMCPDCEGHGTRCYLCTGDCYGEQGQKICEFAGEQENCPTCEGVGEITFKKYEDLKNE